MSEFVLQLTDATKAFGSKVVIANMNLQIRKGDFVVLLGPSGSGKSTLLRLIAGLEKWTSGKMDRSSGLRSSFVFQEPNLLPWRTVLENAFLPLEFISEKNSESYIAKANTVLKMVQLEAASHLYPRELSGGMKMRASIARALITDPDVLFMDEPFAALDEPTREELQYQLRTIWQTRKSTIIFVTHSLSEAAFLAERLIILNHSPSQIVADLRSTCPDHRDGQTRTSSPFLADLNKLRLLVRNETFSI